MRNLAREILPGRALWAKSGVRQGSDSEGANRSRPGSTVSETFRPWLAIIDPEKAWIRPWLTIIDPEKAQIRPWLAIIDLQRLRSGHDWPSLTLKRLRSGHDWPSLTLLPHISEREYMVSHGSRVIKLFPSYPELSIRKYICEYARTTWR